MWRVTVFYLKLRPADRNYSNFFWVSQHPKLREITGLIQSVLLLPVERGWGGEYWKYIFQPKYKISPPVTPDTKQGSSASGPAVLALSYSYCIRLLCACLISPSYHLYLFYRTHHVRELLRNVSPPASTSPVWYSVESALHLSDRPDTERRGQGKRCKFVCQQRQRLAKTCKSEPQIEKDHHLVRIYY